MKHVRVAAVQLEAKLGNVASNLVRVERLVKEAFQRGANWVILPEFFTSAMAFHPDMLDVASPLDGPPTQLLLRLAKTHRGVVGGSFLAHRGKHTYNTFVLAFPNGLTFTHDKDIPTMWENCYYLGGNDDGVLETPEGNVGSALCWEFVRSQTARRMQGKVGLVVGGSCWWTVRDDHLQVNRDVHEQLLSILEDMPGRFARMLGVPIVHAAHVGAFEGFAFPDGDVPYRSSYLGETQIVDGHGRILERLSHKDGEGVIVADVTLGEPVALGEAIPERYWIPELPRRSLAAWERYNPLGRDYYNSSTLPHHRARGNLPTP